MDASNFARDPASMREAANAAFGIAESSTGTPAGPANREVFAALDAETATRKPTWIHAGAQRAEAGFHDPALGWVSVRADMSGGGIHAALVPGSAEAAQALGGHLSGLNAFLAEQHTPVESLTLAQPESRGAGSDLDQGGSHGTHQGTGQNGREGANSGSQSNFQPDRQGISTAASAGISSLTGRPDLFVHASMPGGNHISVMV